MQILFYLLIAYFLGSLPFGLVFCRLFKKIDIREHGSKNIGATNVFRVAGKGLGTLVLFLDVLKGYLAVLFPQLVFNAELAIYWTLLLGVIAILGHSFPLWLKFKGGKGVASSLGVFLAICPTQTLITFAIFLIIFIFSRILSLGSLGAALAFPFVIFFTSPEPSIRLWLLPTSILLALFIFYTHRANLTRLRKGEEKQLF